jgi:hypothetical protein
MEQNNLFEQEVETEMEQDAEVATVEAINSTKNTEQENSLEQSFNDAIKINLEGLKLEDKKDTIKKAVKMIRETTALAKEKGTNQLKKNSLAAVSLTSLLESIVSIPNETGFNTAASQVVAKLATLIVEVPKTNIIVAAKGHSSKIAAAPALKASDKVVFAKPIQVYLHNGMPWGDIITQTEGLTCEEIRKRVAEQYPYYELECTNYRYFDKGEISEIFLLLEGMNKKG